MVLLLILLLVVVIFAATPFSLIEGIINLAIQGFNWLIAVLLAIVNGVAQVILFIVYGIVNFIMGAIIYVIGTVIPMAAWVPLEIPTETLFEFTLGAISFTAMGIDANFSPIGLALPMQ